MTAARPLDGRVAVITGGGSGIGRAVAGALARAGARVHLLGRGRSRLESAAASIPGALWRTCDVRSASSTEEALSAIGDVDVLVNAAGVVHAGEAHEISPKAFAETVSTNLVGAFHACRVVLPSMRARRRGDIVNVASVAVEQDFATMAAYAASKAGLVALSGVIRTENRAFGVRVLDLVAGATDTELWESFWPDAPRARMMTPDDVATCILTAVTMSRTAMLERVVLRPLEGDL